MLRLPLKPLFTLLLALVIVTRVWAQQADESRPKRLYINVSESEKLVFPEPIDTITSSIAKVVKIQQPSDQIVLIEALEVGRTTVTVTLVSGAIERYFISTFENRGADLLNIQNQFLEKGYKLLKVSFERDQIMLSGTVPTQEELDDAIKIVKRYTPYINVRATVGQIADNQTEISEDESIVINSIQSIAKVKGLIVRVKFPPISESIESKTQRFSGDRFQNTTTSRSDNAGRVTDSRIEFPGQTGGGTGAGGAQAGATSVGPEQKRPLENVQETITRQEKKSVPEKIFLYGQVENDIEKARAIRVARTFCPLVVTFITVRDPIQVRIDLSIVEVNLSKTKNLGLRWQGSGPNSSPSLGASVGYSAAGTTGNVFDDVLNKLTYGLSVNTSATLNLLEESSAGRVIQRPSIFLSNGQPGSFFVGDTIPYVSGFTTTTGVVNNQIIPQVNFVSLGVSISIYPLNWEVSSQNKEFQYLIDNTGNRLVGSSAEQKRLQNFQQPQTSSDGTLSNIIEPEVDDSLKYVDENGLVGMAIRSELSSLIQFDQITNEIKVPRTSRRALSSRVFLRDGESCVVSGLFDDSVNKSIRKFPFLADIPIFGWLFTNPSSSNVKSEILFVYTPTVIRTTGPKSAGLNPRSNLPESELYQKQINLQASRPGLVPYDNGRSTVPPGHEFTPPTVPGAGAKKPVIVSPSVNKNGAEKIQDTSSGKTPDKTTPPVVTPTPTPVKPTVTSDLSPRTGEETLNVTRQDQRLPEIIPTTAVTPSSAPLTIGNSTAP